MAKKQTSKKQTRKRAVAAKRKPTVISMRPSVVVSQETPIFYCNYAEVAHSKYEFAITFLRVPTKPSLEQIAIAQSGNPVPIEAQVQIILSAKMIEGLISALQNQQRLYQEQDSERKN